MVEVTRYECDNCGEEMNFVEFIVGLVQDGPRKQYCEGCALALYHFASALNVPCHFIESVGTMSGHLAIFAQPLKHTGVSILWPEEGRNGAEHEQEGDCMCKTVEKVERFIEAMGETDALDVEDKAAKVVLLTLQCALGIGTVIELADLCGGFAQDSLAYAGVTGE